MRIVVNTWWWEAFTLEVEESNTITDVKVKIQEKTGVHPLKQILYYDNRELKDWCTIQYYNIEDNDIMHLYERDTKVRVNVKTAVGKIIGLDMQRSDTIEDLLEMLEYSEGIYRERISLFPHPPLNQAGNQQTLEDLKIKDNATFHLVMHSCGDMKIHVQTFWNSAIITLDVEASHTIGQLKAALRKACITDSKLRALEDDDQRLIFAERRLADDRTLWDCGVRDGAFLVEDQVHDDDIVDKA